MARPSTRARALGLARRLAADALQRLAREVDRLSVALEPLREAAALREPRRAEELEVTRGAAPAWAPARTAARPERFVSKGAPGAEDGRERGSGGSAARLDRPLVPAAPGSSAIVASAPAASGAAAIVASAPAASEPSVIVTSAPAASGAAAIVETPTDAAAEPPGLSPAMQQVVHLRAAIEPQLVRLREHGAWEQAEDPAEAVRRGRVATRRLRAFVRLLAPIVGDKRARKLERRLRTITRALGPLREHDVLIAGLQAEHAGAEPLARAALEHVMAWAQAQRRKAVRKTSDALADVDAPALAASLDAELERVCGRLLQLDEELPAHASAWIEPELRRAFDAMPRPRDETDLEALHEVRIRAKRLRYAIELLRPTLPEPQRSLRPLLERVQSKLGDHRELAQLGERLHARREGLAAQGLHTLATALAPVEAEVAARRVRAFEHAMRALARLDARDDEVPPAAP